MKVSHLVEKLFPVTRIFDQITQQTNNKMPILTVGLPVKDVRRSEFVWIRTYVALKYFE